MKTSENITIAVLSISAIILLVALLGSHFVSVQPALAGMPFSQGDYMICTGAYAAGLDVVYVLQPSARRLERAVAQPCAAAGPQRARVHRQRRFRPARDAARRLR